MIGGLGLFFAGVWFLTENLKRVAGRRFRKAVISQSAAAISIIVVALAGSGVFGIEQSMVTIYGTNFGSSALTLLLSSGLRGRSMQVAIYQVALNILGCLILVPLFYVELYGDAPLMRHLVESITANVKSQMAYVYLIFNLVGATALLAIRPESLLERYWPPGETEDDAHPRYIRDQALGDPDTALDLAALEQLRLIKRWPRYLEAVRTTNGSTVGNLGTLHESFQLLAGQVAEFIQGVGTTNPSSATYLRLNDFFNNQRVIQSAEATLNELTLSICDIPVHSPLTRISTVLTEALDAVLLTLIQFLAEGDDFDKRLLENITGDRGEVFHRLRDVHLSEHRGLSADEKIRLLEITNATERLLWLLGELKVDVLVVAATGSEPA